MIGSKLLFKLFDLINLLALSQRLQLAWNSTALGWCAGLSLHKLMNNPQCIHFSQLSKKSSCSEKALYDRVPGSQPKSCDPTSSQFQQQFLNDCFEENKQFIFFTEKCFSFLDILRQHGQLQGERQPLPSAVCGSLHPNSASRLQTQGGSAP